MSVEGWSGVLIDEMGKGRIYVEGKSKGSLMKSGERERVESTKKRC
jgi:hypothetical protein